MDCKNLLSLCAKRDPEVPGNFYSPVTFNTGIWKFPFLPSRSLHPTLNQLDKSTTTLLAHGNFTPVPGGQFNSQILDHPNPQSPATPISHLWPLQNLVPYPSIWTLVSKVLLRNSLTCLRPLKWSWSPVDTLGHSVAFLNIPEPRSFTRLLPVH